MKKNDTYTFSQVIWHSLAFFQAKLDDALQFTFKKASSLWNSKFRKDTHISKRILYKTAGFLWDIGNSFYSEYKKIKSTSSKSSLSINKKQVSKKAGK